MATDTLDLEQVYAFTIQLAKDAGALILAGSSKRTSSTDATTGVDAKKNRVDRTVPLPLFAMCCCDESQHQSLLPSTPLQRAPPTWDILRPHPARLEAQLTL